MTKYFCDKCQEELKDKIYYIEHEGFSKDPLNHDWKTKSEFCYHCFQKRAKFLLDSNQVNILICKDYA